jgi:hypothetical protein
MVVAILTAASLLNGIGPVLGPASPQPSGPGATPISLVADVGWIQTGSNGSYDIYLTQVDQVCPLGDPSACSPLQDTARTSITLGSRPTSVSRSPSSGQLVVVGSGSSVLVVPVPTPASARPAATPAIGSPRPGSSSTRSSGSPPATSPSPATASARASGSGALPSASAETAGAIAIADGVVVVGGSAAYSADGLWFAFAARPVDNSAGPDIYLWRVGDRRAAAVTTDHRSVFSGWLGGLVLGSRVEVASGGPVRPAGSAAPLASSVPSAGATPSATPSATPTSAPSASSPAGSSIPGGAAAPTATARAASPAATRSAAPTAPTEPVTGASATPVPELRSTSFLLDPNTREHRDLASPSFRPVVDATGQWVSYWEGTLTASQSGLEWRPAAGRLVVAK